MKIVIVLLINTLISFVCFFLKLAQYLHHSDGTAIEWIVIVLYYSTNGFLSQLSLTLVLEFIIAQSPYNMRGLFVSTAEPLALISAAAGLNIGQVVSSKIVGRAWSSLVLFAMKTVHYLVGFLLFCIVACWYKLRVRDENYSPQRVVEEVYDRYLTAAELYFKRYYRTFD